jgi:hypothetical protein
MQIGCSILTLEASNCTMSRHALIHSYNQLRTRGPGGRCTISCALPLPEQSGLLSQRVGGLIGKRQDAVLAIRGDARAKLSARQQVLP